MTKAKDEAADCPWCGPMRRHYGFTIGRFGTRVHCFCCDAMGPIGTTQEQALENWNRRADMIQAMATAALPRCECGMDGPCMSPDCKDPIAAAILARGDG